MSDTVSLHKMIVNTNNTSTCTALCRPGNAGLIGSLYAIFTGLRYIYSDKQYAIKNNGSSTGSLTQAKAGTATKITGTSLSGSTLIAIVSINTKDGTKTGYVYVGPVKLTSNTSGTFNFTGSPPTMIEFGTTKQIKNDSYRLTDKDYYAKSSYTLLNLGNDEINPDAVVEGSTDVSDSSDSSSGDSSAVSTEVPYDFALSTPSSYPKSFGEHFGAFNSLGMSVSNLITEQTNIDNNPQGNKTGIDYSKLRSIFGIPYQFLPTTDCRVGSNWSNDIESAGYEIAEKIVSRLPILYITPGNTSFMGGTTEEKRTTLIGSLSKDFIGETSQTSLEAMLEDYSGKLYSINPAYVEYFKYVNPMCRSGAYFLGIQDLDYTSISMDDEKSGSSTFGNLNWGTCEGLSYEIYEDEETTDTEEENSEENSSEETNDAEQEETKPKKEKYVENYTFGNGDNETSLIKTIEKSLYYGNTIAFYINSDASFQDSFGNETTDSTLTSMINGLSDKAREMQFLLGTASDMVGEAFDKVSLIDNVSEIKDKIDSIVSGIAGGNSIFSTIASSVKTIVSGGRLLFPQIWSNSTFSRSYNISIKLNTPSTDKLSWFLDIYVPLCHLMGLVLPRSEYTNSYTTPFLIKAFYKGMFNIDMGIITEMTFNKGKEGSWTKDALPTVVDVSFTIQDLYSSMGMTSTAKMFKGTTLQNVAEMDYIANLCGININEPDVLRMINFWGAFNIKNRIYDFIPNLEMGITRYFKNRAMQLYNNFWF